MADQGTRRLPRLVRAVRTDRGAAYAALVLLVLIAAGVVVSQGAVQAVVPVVSDIGAWLANTRQGSVVHANGLSGKADARVTLHNAQGHPLQVIQDGGTVLVVDTVTGVVSRIDPAQLAVTQSVRYGTAGTQIVVGGGQAYLIDAEHGVVQRIDLAGLSAIGAPVQLPERLGPGGIDKQGTLWVPVPKAGQLVPVSSGVAGTPVGVGQPGDTLTLTIANGTPVVTDTTRATMTVVSRSGGTVTVNLPESGPAALLAPATTDTPLVPVVAPDGHRLVLVNTTTGTPTSVTLADVGADELGAPAVLGDRVYVPDNSTGKLIVYDSTAGQLLDQISVSATPSKLDLFVKDGILWANAADGPQAVSVDGKGTVHHIGKYDQQLPGGPLPVPSSSPPVPPLAAKAPTQPGPVTRSKTDRGPQPAPDPATPKQQPSPSKSPVPPPPPPPPPQAPPSVTETAQSGSILVTFTPVGGGGARDYALTGAPGSASIAPQRIPGSGSAYRFTVTGLNCGTQYRFSVTANYPSGSASTTASAGARPCVVPGAPGNLRFDNGTQHQIGVAWDAPGNDGGASVHYDVAWGGGRHGGITGTGYTITGLTNFRDYTVSVAAVNPAGSSQPPATGSVGLRPGTWGGTIGNNQLYPVNVRQQPDTGSPIVHQFPAGGGQSVTVICETDGGAWRDPTGSPSGSTWYRISGPSGYVATAYVNTSSGVWSCS